MESVAFVIVVVVCCLLQPIRTAEICCPGISPCFSDETPKCDRPLPLCPEDQGIVMTLYTRRNPSNGQSITRDDIPSVFDGNVVTMFIVHGWLQNETAPWMHDMKNSVLAKVDYNVVIVGWGVGARNLWYPQSASNTRAVGAEIALVSNATIDWGGSSRAKQYCVGHSLGGHVCGFAGQYGQFGRITGLDPAGPFFDDRDWTCGLNPFCADLVDVIHTNGGQLVPPVFGLGTLKALGDVDFYPNGGSQQAGCAIDPFSGLLNLNGIFTSHDNNYEFALELTLGCSHIRAYQFFNESITTPCFQSRNRYIKQSILPVFYRSDGEVVESLGFSANSYDETGLFYLKTNPASPFCQN